MFSFSFTLFAKKASASVSAASSTLKKKAVIKGKSVAASSSSSTSAAAAAPLKGNKTTDIISVDASRFTSKTYTSGKTKSNEIFKKSFLDSIDADLLTSPNSHKNKSSSSSSPSASSASPSAAPLTASSPNNSTAQCKKRHRRPNPFALLSVEEKDKFNRLVRKNVRELNKPSAANDLAERLKAATVANEKAVGTALPVMKASSFANLKNMKRAEVAKIISSDNVEAQSRLLREVILKKFAETAKRNRVRSRFYSVRAAKVRHGTYSAPNAGSSAVVVKGEEGGKVTKKNTSTTKIVNAKKTKKSAPAPSKKIDNNNNNNNNNTTDVNPLNPIHITSGFFTQYERRQYERLRRASLSLRDPKRGELSRRRGALYRHWDKVMKGL